MIIIEGIPLFYLELAVGQRLRKGAVGAWNQVILVIPFILEVNENTLVRRQPVARKTKTSEVPGSIPGLAKFIRGNLIMQSCLWSFSPFH